MFCVGIRFIFFTSHQLKRLFFAGLFYILSVCPSREDWPQGNSKWITFPKHSISIVKMGHSSSRFFEGMKNLYCWINESFSCCEGPTLIDKKWRAQASGIFFRGSLAPCQFHFGNLTFQADFDLFMPMIPGGMDPRLNSWLVWQILAQKPRNWKICWLILTMIDGRKY